MVLLLLRSTGNSAVLLDDDINKTKIYAAINNEYVICLVKVEN